ncbi:hypothetical protein [Rhizobium binae]|nr:hypothetical protein [Rhizobium binae]
MADWIQHHQIPQNAFRSFSGLFNALGIEKDAAANLLKRLERDS